MSKWAIEFISFGQYPALDYEFYTGGSYIYQGGRYLNFSRQAKDAKTYSSKKRAENALTAMEGKCENFWKGRVVEL